MSMLDRILQWWERHTYPQDEKMNERVKQLQKDLAHITLKDDLPPKIKTWDWSKYNTSSSDK